MIAIVLLVFVFPQCQAEIPVFLLNFWVSVGLQRSRYVLDWYCRFWWYLPHAEWNGQTLQGLILTNRVGFEAGWLPSFQACCEHNTLVTRSAFSFEWWSSLIQHLKCPNVSRSGSLDFLRFPLQLFEAFGSVPLGILLKWLQSLLSTLVSFVSSYQLSPLGWGFLVASWYHLHMSIR